MKTFCVEQYLLYVGKFEIQADSKAEAVAKVLNGDTRWDTDDDDPPKYLEEAEIYGMAQAEDAEMSRELVRLKRIKRGKFIPTIRRVWEIEPILANLARPRGRPRCDDGEVRS